MDKLFLRNDGEGISNLYEQAVGILETVAKRVIEIQEKWRETTLLMRQREQQKISVDLLSQLRLFLQVEQVWSETCSSVINLGSLRQILVDMVEVYHDKECPIKSFLDEINQSLQELMNLQKDFEGKKVEIAKTTLKNCREQIGWIRNMAQKQDPSQKNETKEGIKKLRDLLKGLRNLFLQRSPSATNEEVLKEVKALIYVCDPAIAS